MKFLKDPVSQGACNLLVNCAGTRAGDRLLIVHEPKGLGYYDTEVVDAVARCAVRLGAEVTLLEVPFDPMATEVPQALTGPLAQADQTVFLARIGDQMRFQNVTGGGRIIVGYTLDPGMLGSGFGTAQYRAFDLLRQAINRMIGQAQAIRITCPRGTDCTGAVPRDTMLLGDVSIRRFPMPIHAPVPASGFSGRVALPGFVVGTGARYYEPYACTFDGVVMMHFDSGRMTELSGPVGAVAKVRDHFVKVPEVCHTTRDIVHSWHAGIHPGCSFPHPARNDWQRWSGGAFGNPRVLHFHTCGATAPGEVSLNIIDPTVTIDGTAVWENGVLHADRIPGGAAILGAYPCAAELFADPSREIGLPEF